MDPKVADDLFGAMGPLASFRQRIAVAYAFGFLSKEDYDNLNLVRRIRNHFAHHPLEASFDMPASVARMELCGIREFHDPAFPDSLHPVYLPYHA
ncbi:MAG: hypothetical protein ACREU8_05700 [Gammaproteobacteria bacterium]